ncbi:MAG: DUF1460 domain-containing protein [Tannerella sp.]|jgi:hypothetical protein|nr:DUF1460 domain-containing protein [Tannerella sp.]
MKSKVLIISVLFLSIIACQGKTKPQAAVNQSAENQSTVLVKADFTDEDKRIFTEYIQQFKAYNTENLNNIIIRTALFFKDRPYVAHTLEKDPETLVVNLREFDCTTLVESVLALSRTLKYYPDPVFENFCGELQKIRYRNAEIQDYTSRLHYTSDWVFENERKGLVKDVTRQIGGEPYPVNVSFMSSHPDSYPQLEKYPDFVNAMAKKEKEISERKNYALIPKNKIKSSEKGIENGDIVCFVTDIKGLDISHVGFLYIEKGVLTFIHASSQQKKVIVNPESLIDYVSGIKSNKGIMTVRAVEFF